MVTVRSPSHHRPEGQGHTRPQSTAQVYTIPCLGVSGDIHRRRPDLPRDWQSAPMWDIDRLCGLVARQPVVCNQFSHRLIVTTVLVVAGFVDGSPHQELLHSSLVCS